MTRALIDIMDKGRPVSHWWEEEIMDGSKVRSLTIILRSKGCSYSIVSPCTMCGYHNDTCPDIGSEDLIAQIVSLEGQIKGAKYIKIFTSGSFLDKMEIPKDAREAILEIIHALSPDARLLVETRPEFVRDDTLAEILSVHGNIELAIGLESADDEIRKDLIGKSFRFDDYMKACDLSISKGIKIKTYLLLKPPFLSEARSIEDAINSIVRISQRVPDSTISINPTNVQRDTIVENLHDSGHFRPPWLWSVIRVLKEGMERSGGKVRLVSYPTAGGRRRGTHNCGKCDQTIMEAISRFDLTGDPSSLDVEMDCCQELWREYLLSE